MKKALPYLATFITGAVISVMVIFNTELGKVTSSEVSLIVNQIVGILVLSLIIWTMPANKLVNPARKKAPWWLHFGGLFGVVIISINFFSVTGAGATIAMAGTVFGQSLMGLIMDMTGFMGVKKEKITMRRALSLLICLAGIVIPFFTGKDLNLMYLVLAVFAGAITMIQMVYNSKLAFYRGPISSARTNVISGLFGALAYGFIFFPETTPAGFRVLFDAPLWLILAGGTVACFVVVSSNVIIPKIPAVYSALLISSGQILAAVVFDIALYDIFDPSLLSCALLMLLGIAVSFEGRKKAA